MTTPRVAVVVPVHDMAGALQRCLDALAAQVSEAEHVVVVDDASTDGSAEVADAHQTAPTVVRLRSRVGAYAARNAGAATVGNVDVLAFTDADCAPAPTWIDEGLRAVRQHGVVGGAVCIRLPATPNRWELYDAAMYLDQETHVRREQFAATANLWVRRDVWRDVGAFRQLDSGGDVEWGRRAAAKGHAIAYAAECLVEHPPRSTALETWRLHRRLGTGWSELAALGLWPPIREDLALRTSMSYVRHQCDQRGVSASVRRLALPHVVAMVARISGRVSVRRRAARS